MHLTRRELGASVGAAILTGGAGCAGLGGLSVTSTTANGTIAGNIEITATIENPSSETQTGQLTGEVTIEDGDAYSETTSVSVPGETQTTESVTVDIPLSRSLSEFRYQYDAWIE